MTIDVNLTTPPDNVTVDLEELTPLTDFNTLPRKKGWVQFDTHGLVPVQESRRVGKKGPARNEYGQPVLSFKFTGETNVVLSSVDGSDDAHLPALDIDFRVSWWRHPYGTLLLFDDYRAWDDGDIDMLNNVLGEWGHAFYKYAPVWIRGSWAERLWWQLPPNSYVVKSTKFSHLYINTVMPWDEYAFMLQALGEAGILNAGYVRASILRKQSCLRLPGTLKGPHDYPSDEEQAAADALPQTFTQPAAEVEDDTIVFDPLTRSTDFKAGGPKRNIDNKRAVPFHGRLAPQGYVQGVSALKALYDRYEDAKSRMTMDPIKVKDSYYAIAADLQDKIHLQEDHLMATYGVTQATIWRDMRA